jgi:asparagine synthase (glutamine-hydrolysing)
MCGLVAIIDFKKKVDKSELISMRDYMLDRGRDGKGFYISKNKNVGLGHRRMSIIDVSAKANQPLSSLNNKQIKIIYNGEIYNYQKLKKKLLQKGYRFKSNSDTEVILNGYIEWGENIVKLLEGMFSFVIYNEINSELFVARDPFGIKPLYIYKDTDKIIISSQVQAILKSNTINKEISQEGKASFYLWGHIIEPFTFFKYIKCIDSGYFLKINLKGIITKKKYFSLINFYKKKNNIKDSFSKIVSDSVKKHLISDVPLGVFLSSGIDSSVIAAFASKLYKKKIKTLSIGFNQFKNTSKDETKIAKKTSNFIKSSHKNFIIKKYNQTDYMKFLQKMDQPTVDGYNTWLACLKTGKISTKVMFTGVGGDEFFSGYNIFKQLPYLYNNLFLKIIKFFYLGKYFRILLYPILKKLKINIKFSSIFEYTENVLDLYMFLRCYYLPWQIKKYFLDNRLNKGLDNLIKFYKRKYRNISLLNISNQIKILELDIYLKSRLLKDMDWIGHSHNLELRTPLVDLTMLNPSISKTKLDLFYTFKNLPTEIIKKKKTGFEIPLLATKQDYHYNIYQTYLNKI